MALRPSHLKCALAARLQSPKSAIASAATGRRKMADPLFRGKIAKARRDSEKCKASASRVMRDVLSNPAMVSKRKANQLGSPKYWDAIVKHWILKAPNNCVFEFDNLSKFVRENPEMFDASDVIWHRYSCNATKCLSRLRGSRSQPIASWKGWTWVSITERLEGCVALDVDKQNNPNHEQKCERSTAGEQKPTP